MLKNIYKGIIALIVVSITILIAFTLDIFDISSDIALKLIALTTTLITSGFILSRNANVVANKKDSLLPWFTTILLLIYLFIQTLSILVDDFSLPTSISDFIDQVLPLFIFIILVLEIPQVNSLHSLVQKATIVFAIVTAAVSFSLDNITEDLKKANVNDADKKIETRQTLLKIETVCTYLTIGGFLISPMIRTIYYSKDEYANTNEIDAILNNTYNYPNNNNYNNYNSYNNYNGYNNNYNTNMNQPFPQPMQTYQPTLEQQQPLNQNPLPPPIINEIQPTVEEIPKEKVLNQQFHPEALPEAVIPTIGGINDNINQTEVIENAPVASPTVENNSNPLEIASQPDANTVVENEPVASPTVENNSNPLEIVSQPGANTVVEDQPITPPIVSQTTEDNILNIVNPTE